jgi:MraZ protein
MRIPSRYRDELGDDFALSKGPRNSLYILSAKKAREYEDDLIALNAAADIFDFDGQMFLNAAADALYFPDVDDQGRFVLKSDYKSFAGIKKEIVVSGATDKLTLWGAERYDDLFGNENYETMIKKLHEMKLKKAELEREKKIASVENGNAE